MDDRITRWLLGGDKIHLFHRPLDIPGEYIDSSSPLIAWLRACEYADG